MSLANALDKRRLQMQSVPGEELVRLRNRSTERSLVVLLSRPVGVASVAVMVAVTFTLPPASKEEALML